MLGLAFQSLSAFNAPPVFQTLIDQNQVTSPILALKLHGGEVGSELTLGDLNPNIYTGAVTYVDVTEPILLKSFGRSMGIKYQT
jgi:cathepsin D